MSCIGVCACPHLTMHLLSLLSMIMFHLLRSIVAVTFISVFIYVVESAVNTVIVCFAEAPSELGRNHLTHDREMRESWQKVYPTLFFY